MGTDWERASRAGSVEIGEMSSHHQVSPMVAGQMSPGVGAQVSPGSRVEMSPGGRFLVQPVVNVFVSNSNEPVVTSNKYGCLNSSVHGNEVSPQKPVTSQRRNAGNASSIHHQQVPFNRSQSNNMDHYHFTQPRRRLFLNPENLNEESENEERAQSPSGGGGGWRTTKAKTKRSKSASPTRP